MLDNIGRIAGAIWHYLEKNGEATLTKIIREIGETERSVLMAIGWLAREEKLRFRRQKNRVYIALKTQPSGAGIG